MYDNLLLELAEGVFWSNPSIGHFSTGSLDLRKDNVYSLLADVMKESHESKQLVISQRATCAVVSWMNNGHDKGAVFIQKCEDDERSIVTAISGAINSTVVLEASSLTESLIKRLESLGPILPKIVVRHDDVKAHEVEELVIRGCLGFITSGISAADFNRMLVALNRGEMWLDRKWSNYVIQKLLSRLKERRLSKRECDVLNLLRGKLKNREIADALAISEETLRWHLRHLYAKTGCQNRNDLVLYAQARIADEALDPTSSKELQDREPTYSDEECLASSAGS